MSELFSEIKEIMRPATGLYKNLSNHEYHSAPGISKSGLDLISRSPAHYKHSYIDKNERHTTPAMIFGTRVHSLVLEPEDFFSKYARTPDHMNGLHKASSTYKKHAIELYEKFPGTEFIDEDSWGDLMAIRKQILVHPLAPRLLTGGAAELSAFWEDKTTGVLCKCRPDYFKSNGVVVDIKTTSDASYDAFEKSIANFRYHVAAAWYLDGMKIAGAEYDPTHFVFLVVENKPPFEIAIYQAEDAMIEKGREIYERDLLVYADCVKKNQWPGYTQEVTQISLPYWAF